MDKVVIDLYKKKLYTDETFKKFVRVGWITPEQFKETTGKDYEPQVKQLVVFIISEVGVYMTESSQRGDYERRIKRLEDNDEKIFNSLEQIKDGQHNQNLINQKMNFTLDSINRERELESQNKKENQKNIKDIKMWVLGLVGTIAGSLIVAVLRMFFGV